MKQGNTAVVIGASIAGLSAASALSPHFERVIVLERDVLPDGPEQRPSVAQGKHVHALLAGGQVALDALFPELSQQLMAAGAVRMNVALDLQMERLPFDPFPSRDFGFHCSSSSRPLLECLVRKRVRALPNVTIESACDVQALTVGTDGVSVSGVRYSRQPGAPTQLATDLVIDASGRGEPTLQLLRELSIAEPPTSTIGVNQGYTSALFEIPDDATDAWKGVSTFGNAPLSSRGGLMLPIENQRWLLSVGGRDGEQPPGDKEQFWAFVRNLRTPTIFRAIESAVQIGEPLRFGFRESRWRHFERMPQFPRGLLVIGDAICRFNPIYGQGMTVAAQQAVALAQLLASVGSNADPIATLPSRFFAEAAQLVDGPWQMSALPDFLFRQTRGDRPENLSRMLRWNSELFMLAAEDADAHRVLTEVNHLLKRTSAFDDEGISCRVDERLQRRASSRR